MQIFGGLGVSRKNENTAFVCINCGKTVPPLSNGSYRNHCPYCLYSLHVDIVPGDRKNECHGRMKPIGILFNSKKGYQIKHKCEKCGTEKVNCVAMDTEVPDSMDMIIYLMLK
jgi:DNA-directed RNA polymerase subunit RPC12/RpoP